MARSLFQERNTARTAPRSCSLGLVGTFGLSFLNSSTTYFFDLRDKFYDSLIEVKRSAGVGVGGGQGTATRQQGPLPDAEANDENIRLQILRKRASCKHRGMDACLLYAGRKSK